MASSTRHAADPRDKLYALLGLLPQNLTRMHPDYTIPYWQLVINFVIDQAQRYEDLWFLHACGTDWEVNRQRNDLDLGGSHEEQLSWVPDLLNPLSLKLVVERKYAPYVNAPFFRQETVQRTGNGRLRVHGIAVGIFQRVGADESETCSIAPIPTCVIEAMSRGTNWGSAKLSFNSSKNCQQYLEDIDVDLEVLHLQPAVVSASDPCEHMALHLRRACRCLLSATKNRSFFRSATTILPLFEPKGWNGARTTCPISPEFVNCKIKAGDLLCVLSNGDGLFALRHLPQMGPFRLVGSAIAPGQELATYKTTVSCRWRIPSEIL
jgi:hypothetical protein